MAKKKTGQLPEIPKTTAMAEKETELGKDLRVVIPELFEVHYTQSAVAEALGIDQSTLSRWCDALGIVLVRRAVLQSELD